MVVVGSVGAAAAVVAAGASSRPVGARWVARESVGESAISEDAGVRCTMATEESFAEYVADQMAADCGITFRKMFGEYGFYSHGKFFGMICDDRLFFKPTEAGRAFIGEVREGTPFPGARPHILIEDEIEDREWLSELVRVTVEALPPPKAKKKRTGAKRKK